jgi:hypothetical protein
MSDPTESFEVPAGGSSSLTAGAVPVEAAPVAAADVPGGARRPPGRRIRSIAVGALVVISSILVLASTVGLWSFRQVYNADVFVDNVNSIVTHPEIQANLANYLTDQIMVAINPEQRARDALPAQADPLIGPVVSAIRGFVNQAALKVVASPQFSQLVDQSARLAHTAAINLLEGKKVAGVTINGDKVVLNTLPMIDRVLQQIAQQGILGNRSIPALSTPTGQPSAQVQELGSKLGITLPPDFGQLVIFKSDSLKTAQQALHLIKRGLVVLVVVTVLLIALTLLLSLHRLKTLAELGIGIAIAMLVAFAVTKAVARDVVGQVGTPAGRQTIRDVARSFLDSLRTLTILLTVLAVILAAVAFLSGSSGSARWIRSKFSRLWRPQPVGEVSPRAGSFSELVYAHRDGLRIVGAGVAVLILLVAGLTWSSVIVAVAIVVLCQCAVWFVRRRTMRRASGGPGSAAPAAQGASVPAGTPPLMAGESGT